jgi:hypothetical protein
LYTKLSHTRALFIVFQLSASTLPIGSSNKIVREGKCLKDKLYFSAYKGLFTGGKISVLLKKQASVEARA